MRYDEAIDSAAENGRRAVCGSAAATPRDSNRLAESTGTARSEGRPLPFYIHDRRAELRAKRTASRLRRCGERTGKPEPTVCREDRRPDTSQLRGEGECRTRERRSRWRRASRPALFEYSGRRSCRRGQVVSSDVGVGDQTRSAYRAPP